MMQITPTVKQLLIINIMVFVAGNFIPQLDDLFALHFFMDQQFGVWQLLTHIFMHGNLMHIAFNMLALVSFGSLLEQYWGAPKFLFFYFSCGLGAALLQLGINYLEFQHVLAGAAELDLSYETLRQIVNVPFSDGTHYRGELFAAQIEPILQSAGKLQQLSPASMTALFNAAVQSDGIMVGASGAIYGLLVAFAFMFPMAELAMMFIPVPIKAKYFVPGIITLDLVLGLYGSSIFGDNSQGGVAHFAHIGGAIVGFIMMWMWKRNSFNDRRWN